MHIKKSSSTIQLPQLKAQLYAIQSDPYDFATVLSLLKKEYGFYPGTLLKYPVALDHLTIKENILLAYSIAHPKKRNKERIVMDLLENNGVDIDYISNHSFSALPMHSSLNIQLLIHYLCGTKIILVEDWINELSDYELTSFLLLLKNICSKQDVTVLIDSLHPRIKDRCDDILPLKDYA